MNITVNLLEQNLDLTLSAWLDKLILAGWIKEENREALLELVMVITAEAMYDFTGESSGPRINFNFMEDANKINIHQEVDFVRSLNSIGFQNKDTLPKNLADYRVPDDPKRPFEDRPEIQEAYDHVLSGDFSERDAQLVAENPPSPKIYIRLDRGEIRPFILDRKPPFNSSGVYRQLKIRKYLSEQLESCIMSKIALESDMLVKKSKTKGAYRLLNDIMISSTLTGKYDDDKSDKYFEIKLSTEGEVSSNFFDEIGALLVPLGVEVISEEKGQEKVFYEISLPKERFKLPDTLQRKL
ncbi:hypothetical protein FC36_GL002081 [Ligilactobacillus equi DSM 15833 = JCM 10991]|uniref:Uncharacterized protein n=2 Tax=Ligilactobacillus equi TaxID=137357 RepID=A0A0R1TR89_9LACO|nr:hypothetical protein FC36_GL002081 [Ligilactobacillus equi DSM 15833 = JCM 10991]